MLRLRTARHARRVRLISIKSIDRLRVRKEKKGLTQRTSEPEKGTWFLWFSGPLGETNLFD
jgi:hypothetical protein